MLFFIFLAETILSMFFYSENIRKPKNNLSSKTIFLYSIPFLISVMIAIFSAATHSLFYFDNGYNRGPAYVIYLCILSLYLLHLVVNTIIQAHYEINPSRKQKLIQMIIFPCMCGLTFFLSVFFVNYPIISIGLTLNLILLHLSVLYESITIDPLTGLNNRQRLLDYISDKIHNPIEDVYIAMIDADNFKYINDNFGHIEGDLVLKEIADALKNACHHFKRRPYIARYGGDEFIIIIDGNYNDITNLMIAIRKNIQDLNTDKKDYNINISIGLSRCDDQNETITSLIHQADQNLYKEKMLHKQFLQK
jgi:diguanylate cyclase (GGDEF)-like protein